MKGDVKQFTADKAREIGDELEENVSKLRGALEALRILQDTTAGDEDLREHLPRAISLLLDEARACAAKIEVLNNMHVLPRLRDEAHAAGTLRKTA